MLFKKALLTYFIDQKPALEHKNSTQIFESANSNDANIARQALLLIKTRLTLC